MAQRRHRGEVAAGLLVEHRDAVGVLVAKVGNPHTTREGLGVEQRQQPVHVGDHVRPCVIELTCAAFGPGIKR